MTLLILQTLVITLGLIVIKLAFSYLLFFNKVNSSISKAMKAFLIEQVIITVCTLAFSANSVNNIISHEHNDICDIVGHYNILMIQGIVFISMLHSSVRLAIEIRKVENNA